MSLSKLFYWLFGISLALLAAMLGYGLQATYNSGAKRVSEEIDRVAHATADTLQNRNYALYDIVRAFADKDYNQKIAFAAGMTQNQRKFAVSFDNSEAGHGAPPPAPAAGETGKSNLTVGVLPATAAGSANHTHTDTLRFNLPTKPTHMSTSQPAKKPRGKNDSVVLNIEPAGQQPIRIAMDKKALDTMPVYKPRGVKTIGDFDSLFAATLRSEGLYVPYHIERVQLQAPPQPWATGLFIINFYQPDVYRVVYTRPTALLWRRMVPYSAASLLVLLLLSAAFILYHKSYRIQLQTAQFRESLLSNVTHELKTPIASMLLINDAMRKAADDPGKQQEYLDFASRELTRMKMLIEKILSFGKLSKSQFALTKEVIGMETLVTEAISIIKPTLDAAGGEIIFEAKARPELMGDRMLLLNMVVNILDNAVKYAQQPRITVTLQQDEDAITLSIADNGIGIPRQFRKKIFEPFFRVPAGDVHNTAGHGIGLSFVSQAVKLHRGKITVQSQPGRGSIFIINLPAL